jgi:DNA-binding NarL/FixJ family response regulator
MSTVSILLIDDHAMFRTGMRLVLQSGIPHAQVLEAASLEEAMRTCSEPPAIVLLDVDLQGLNGVEGIALLKQRWPRTPVVMLSSSSAGETVRLALARGASAFVSKAETAAMIMKVIDQVLDGELPGLRNDAAPGVSPPLLTPRQCEVLDLLAEGLSNKVIARRLNLSEFTVRGHVQAVLGLLGVTSRAQAAFAARQRGLIGH